MARVLYTSLLSVTALGALAALAWKGNLSLRSVAAVQTSPSAYAAGPPAATRTPQQPAPKQAPRLEQRSSPQDACSAPVPEAANAVRPLSHGHLFMGSRDAVAADGSFDLILHLHGEGAVRRELLESQRPFVLVTYTLDQKQSYAAPFAGSNLLQQLLDEVSAAVTKRSSAPARVRHLALSAWSAGFEGIRSILHQPEAEKVDAILLVDGLHAPKHEPATTRYLTPFVEFARRAERGERWFAMTYTFIPTSGFTSTSESAHFVIEALAGRPAPVRRKEDSGLLRIEAFDRGNFHVRGYAGDDKPDHCAQLFLLRGLYRELHRYLHERR